VRCVAPAYIQTLPACATPAYAPACCYYSPLRPSPPRYLVLWAPAVVAIRAPPSRCANLVRRIELVALVLFVLQKLFISHSGFAGIAERMLRAGTCSAVLHGLLPPRTDVVLRLLISNSCYSPKWALHGCGASACR